MARLTGRRRIVLLVLAGAVVVAVGALGVSDAQRFAARLLAGSSPLAGLPPVLAGAVFVLLYAAATVALVPKPVLNLAAGAWFGLAGGLPLAVAATTLGATVSFALGRAALRGRRVGPVLGVPPAEGWGRIFPGPARLARHLAALSGTAKYIQYEADPPPCDAPPAFGRGCPQRQTTRADPRRSAGQALAFRERRGWSAMDRELRDHGFRSVLAMRLLPVLPFAAINYGCAAGGTRLTPFAAATAVGVVPGTAALVLAGATASAPSPAGTWASLAALALLTAVTLAPRARRRVARHQPEPGRVRG